MAQYFMWFPKLFIFLLIILILVSIFKKVRKIILLEIRIRRYSVHDLKDDISFMDKLDEKYHHFIHRYSNNEKIKKRAKGYQKYMVLGDVEDSVFFLLTKLFVGFIFVILVIISYAIRGRLVSFVGFAVSFVIGYYLYDVFLYFSWKYKKKRIKDEMLRAVMLLNNSFKAGKSILQAVRIASEELPKPINLEFKRIYLDMSYGLSADVAFSRFAKRIQLEEATYVASSLIILNKMGGNIVPIFSSIERTLYDKKKLENDLKSSTAASNLVVKFLMGVPIIFVLLIYIMSPTYFNPLFESPLGYFILFMIWMMFVIYIYLLSKILKVKV